MNLLAHLHLGRDLPPAAAVGNLLADFVKLPDDGSLYFAGVRLHQVIDGFTDRHELVAQARNLFKPPRRRFAGILVDLAFDYCLVRSWNQFHLESDIETFVHQQFQAAANTDEGIPPEAREELEYICDGGILFTGIDTAGLRRAIIRITHRSPVTAPMLGAEEEIARLEPDLLPLFCAFYPDLQEVVSREIHTILGDRLDTRWNDHPRT